MKALKNKRTRNLAIMAISLMAFIVGMIFLTSPDAGWATLAIAPIVVGGVTLEGKDAELFTALKAGIQTEVEKYNKEYISKTKLEENVNELLKGFKPNIKDDEDFKALQ